MPNLSHCERKKPASHFAHETTLSLRERVGMEKGTFLIVGPCFPDCIPLFEVFESTTTAQRKQPSMKLFLGIILVVGSIFLSNAQRADMNPCHPKYVKNEPGSMECEQIALPRGFCSTCRMSSFNENGVFSDCTRTMALNSTCISMMQKYVDRNPCDVKRADALDRYKRATNAQEKEMARLRLDWFAFSICEQGCDCIPQMDAQRR